MMADSVRASRIPSNPLLFAVPGAEPGSGGRARALTDDSGEDLGEYPTHGPGGGGEGGRTWKPMEGDGMNQCAIFFL